MNALPYFSFTANEEGRDEKALEGLSKFLNLEFSLEK